MLWQQQKVVWKKAGEKKVTQAENLVASYQIGHSEYAPDVTYDFVRVLLLDK